MQPLPIYLQTQCVMLSYGPEITEEAGCTQVAQSLLTGVSKVASLGSVIERLFQVPEMH